MSKPRRSIRLADVLPRDLPAMLLPHSRLGMGYDIATTTKEKSNPSSLSLVEQIGLDFYARLILRWKTADPAVAKAVILGVLMLLAPRRPVKLCVDASNERYYAAALKSDLGSIVPVDLIVSGEATEYLGEAMSFKVYLGNLLVNTIDEGHLFVANESWIKDDFRLVKRDRGTFDTEVDGNGNHGDTFDSTKLALHALVGGGGPVAASAAAVGTFGKPGNGGRSLRNPYAHLHQRSHVKVNA